MGMFKKATKTKLKARVALIGPSGSGKTFTALRLAQGLGDRVAVLDTERGSASKYASEFDFDVVELEEYPIAAYIKVIEAAAKEGYDVLVIDSLSHAWIGKGGALDEVDKRGGGNGGKFAGWKHVTPLHRQLIDTILGAPMHVIATMRSKTEYAMDKDSRGKTVVRKVGMGAQQRDGMEYEFDVVGELDVEHNMEVTKSRCSALSDRVFRHPGEDVANELRAWLGDGADGREDPTLKPAEKPKHEITTWLEGLTEQAKAREIDALDARSLVYARSDALTALGKEAKGAAFAALKELVDATGEDPEQAGAWVTEAADGGRKDAAE